VRAPIVVLGITLVVVGCASDPVASPATSKPFLGISNGTILAVTVVVNGRSVGVDEPEGPAPTFDAAFLPELPWTVEARSPSGRVLASMHVEAGDIWSTARPGGVVESEGTFARTDLSCGSLRIWAGDVMPSGPMPASPAGSPGDCAP